MAKVWVRYAMGLCLALFLAAGASGQAALAQALAPGPSFETDSLTIETAAGDRHAFTVELAITRDQKAHGLMFRRELSPEAGMLFLHPRERRLSMWMKNTFIPLDMLFIDAEGTIIQIVERTVPQSLRAIRSEAPVLAVLEVNAGTASRLGIAPGDRVKHEAFAAAAN